MSYTPHGHNSGLWTPGNKDGDDGEDYQDGPQRTQRSFDTSWYEDGDNSLDVGSEKGWMRLSGGGASWRKGKGKGHDRKGSHNGYGEEREFMSIPYAPLLAVPITIVD